MDQNAETWRNEKKARSRSTEMGCLRKILGVSRLQKMRNETIRNILEQEETIIDRIQKRRLTWFGHVERMEDNRLQHKTLHCYIEGARSRGKRGLTTWKKIWRRKCRHWSSDGTDTRQTEVEAFHAASSSARLTDENKEEPMCWRFLLNVRRCLQSETWLMTDEWRPRLTACTDAESEH